MERGIRLGIDVGTSRVGVALSDPDGLVAIPLSTYLRDEALTKISQLIDERQVVTCYTGLPLSLSGNETSSTRDARNFASDLAELTTCEVRLVDERLSTVSAQNQLRQQGVTTKKQRPIVDQAAAVIILQHCLEIERQSGRPPGELATPRSSQ